MDFRGGEALIGEIPVTELVRRFGSPLYVYDARAMAQAHAALRAALHPAMSILYSLKANPNVSLTAFFHSLGCGADVSSLGELRTALWAGVPAEQIVFVGPGKKLTELEAAVQAGIGCIVAESLQELSLLDQLGGAAGRRVPVAIRVNPAFSTKGSKLTMGGAPRQFGIDEEDLVGQRSFAAGLRHLDIIGFHAYLGTRILEHDTVIQNTRGIFQTMLSLTRALGVDLRWVDVGGGFGVPYFEGEATLNVEALGREMHPLVDEFLSATAGRPRLYVESGRYLAARGGIYVSQVLYVKESRGERFVICDGGTNHHMAAVGVGSPIRRNFPIMALTRAANAASPATLCGPLCTPSDTLGKNVALPDLEPGDLVGVLDSGAYGASASPINFLGHGHPAEVLVADGKPHLIRRASTPEDLLTPQLLVQVRDKGGVSRVEP